MTLFFAFSRIFGLEKMTESPKRGKLLEEYLRPLKEGPLAFCGFRSQLGAKGPAARRRTPAAAAPGGALQPHEGVASGPHEAELPVLGVPPVAGASPGLWPVH